MASLNEMDLFTGSGGFQRPPDGSKFTYYKSTLRLCFCQVAYKHLYNSPFSPVNRAWRPSLSCSRSAFNPVASTGSCPPHTKPTRVKIQIWKAQLFKLPCSQQQGHSGQKLGEITTKRERNGQYLISRVGRIKALCRYCKLNVTYMQL